MVDNNITKKITQVSIGNDWYLVTDDNVAHNLEDGTGEYSIKNKEEIQNPGTIQEKDRNNYTYGRANLAIGHKNKTYQRDSFAFGGGCIAGKADGDPDDYGYGFAAGEQTKATGRASFAAGSNSTASGDYANAEGRDAIAAATYSHVEGYGNTAVVGANASHAEGQENEISSEAAHVEGRLNNVSGNYAHAEGLSTIASGICAHAQGHSTKAIGEASSASGYNTKANYENQTVVGSCNDNKANTLFEVGNGYEGALSNAFEVLKDGRAKVYGAPIEANDILTKAQLDNAIELFTWADVKRMFI